jgi:2-oxoglutarate ferredoxin oxidoreductase subunit alpha
MPPFGQGYRFHVTGLIHDESGFPNGSPQATQSQMDRLNEKLTDHLDDIITYEEYRLEDADYAVVAFGGTARSAYAAIDQARKQGIKVGMFRPITIWPFAEAQIAKLATKVKAIIVAELNCGQYVGEIQKAVNGKIPVLSHTKYNNEAITPSELCNAIVKLTEEVQ